MVDLSDDDTDDLLKTCVTAFKVGIRSPTPRGVYAQADLGKEKVLNLLDEVDDADNDVYIKDALEFADRALQNRSSPEVMKDFCQKAVSSLERFQSGHLRELGRVEKGKTYETAEEREIARIFRRYGTLTWEELADILDVSESTARRRVEPFIERGGVKKLQRKEGEKLELRWVKG